MGRRESGSRGEYLCVCMCVCVLPQTCVHGGRARVGSYLACLCVYPSVPPRAGMGTPREELGGARISASTTLAGGFNISRDGERCPSERGRHKQKEVRARP